MLKTRLLSALIGIIAILAVIYLGGIYWRGLILLLGILAYYEYLQMIRQGGYHPLFPMGYLLVILTIFLHQAGKWFYPALLLLIVLLVIEAVLKYPQVTVIDTALSFFGAFYIGFLLSYPMQMADMEKSPLIILLALLLTWASDTGGYFGGRFWGKHKLAPLLSPGKTWEGALGGIILTCFTAALFFRFVDMGMGSWAYVILLGVLASIMAQFGDLFISGMKRHFSVKDTGRIIPGHGGILDRFDSFLLVAPVVFYFYSFFV